MARIDLNSETWCNLLFEDKNKAYGAYSLRITYGKRQALALFVVIIFVSILICGTFIARNLTDKGKIVEKMVEVTTLAKLPPAEENKVERIETAPPPPLKSSIKFTAPVIKKDEEVHESDEIKSQDALLAVNTAISIADVAGTDEIHGKDIAEVAQEVGPVEEAPFMSVEQMPQYPGGEKAMIKFIRNNLVYPASVLENGVQGKVLARFVVTKTGAIEKIQIIRTIDPECSEEVIRVIKLMPKWIPGRQNGTPVPVYYVFPIIFELN